MVFIKTRLSNEIGFTPKEAIAMLERTQTREMRNNLSSPFNDGGEYDPAPIDNGHTPYRLNVNDLQVLAQIVPFSTNFMMNMCKHPEQFIKYTELGGVDQLPDSMKNKSLYTKSFEDMDGVERMEFYNHTVHSALERFGQIQEQKFGKNPFKEAQQMLMQEAQITKELGINNDADKYDLTNSDGIVQRLIDSDKKVVAYQNEVQTLNRPVTKEVDSKGVDSGMSKNTDAFNSNNESKGTDGLDDLTPSNNANAFLKSANTSIPTPAPLAREDSGFAMPVTSASHKTASYQVGVLSHNLDEIKYRLDDELGVSDDESRKSHVDISTIQQQPYGWKFDVAFSGYKHDARDIAAMLSTIIVEVYNAYTQRSAGPKAFDGINFDMIGNRLNMRPISAEQLSNPSRFPSVAESSKPNAIPSPNQSAFKTAPSLNSSLLSATQDGPSHNGPEF